MTLLTLSWLISPIYPNAAKLDLGQKEAQKAVEPPGGTGTTTLPYFITVKFNPEVSVSKYAEPNDTFIRQRNAEHNLYSKDRRWHSNPSFRGRQSSLPANGD